MTHRPEENGTILTEFLDTLGDIVLVTDEDAMYRVDASGLNLRTSPVVRPGTRITVLPRGHVVTVLGPTRRVGWVQVSTQMDGEPVTGYVAERFLVPVSDFGGTDSAVGVREVHLRENRPEVRRDADGFRAYPLGEPGRPARDPSGTREEKRADLTEIVDWLDVENSARYDPSSSRTFCNIYVHDYCYLANVYLPRVWWTEKALVRLEAGKRVAPEYAATVRELNANSLFDWLHEWGPHFGWTRVFDLAALQAAANDGGVGVIVGQRHDLNRSGHIVVAVPEVGEHTSIRRDGHVTRPLQSQAGSKNHKYVTHHWWTHPRFRDFAFWTSV